MSWNPIGLQPFAAAVGDGARERVASFFCIMFDNVPVGVPCGDLWRKATFALIVGGVVAEAAAGSGGIGDAANEAQAAAAYQEAVAKIGSLLNDDADAYATQLTPGKAYIVDNTRVLHGRREVPKDTIRHVSGADVSEWALRAMWRYVN